MKLFNTESRQKELITPIEGNTLRMYTCGPTVYNYAHIGNFRTYVFEDLLRRTLKWLGYTVIQVMNITDIDDKTLKGAIREGISLKDFTRPFTEAFFEDLQSLHIEKVEHYPFATDFLPEMIQIIEGLLEKGVAYRGIDGSVYFAIHRFPSYGRLSHLHLQDLQAGASQRVAQDEYEKEHVSDFVLWKAYDPQRDGDIYWESPFGQGRPGWHIECSAMAMKLLGSSIDIHVGGVDNMFPHHENEIAQSEAYSCCRFVRYWLHAEHLLVDHKKMSKSLGNFFTLRDLLQKGYTGLEIRYLLLQTHYRTQLNFTLAGLDGARASLQRLSDFIARLQNWTGKSVLPGKAFSLLTEAETLFRQHLSDDLNISAALAVLFDLVRDINTLCDNLAISEQEARQVLQFLHQIDLVLGVLPLTPQEEEIPAKLQVALKEREEARLQKNWALADACRLKIDEAGYLIEDTPKGTRLKKKRVL